MAEKGKSCSLAVSLAVASLTKNGDLARKLASLSEQLNADYLYEDALRQGVDMGVEGDAKQLAHEYSLKQESTQIKFKAMLFGGLLANTNQGDDAIRQMMIAIGETGGTVAEGLEALDIMSKLDLTDLEEVAKVIGGTVEEATKITKGIRKKISHYIGSNYSVVTSGSQIKAEAVQKKLEKEIKQSKDIITKAKNVLGRKTYKDVNKDLARLQNAAKDNKKYWSTKAGRNEIRKLATKYGTPVNKDSLERYLNKIIDAQKTLESESKILDELTKEYNDALKLDLKIVEDGQNPYNYVGADGEWKFNKTYNKDISERVLEYGQYALARTLLTDKGGIPQSVYDILAKTVRQAVKKGQVVNYLDEDLTEDWILDEDRTLDELLSRAYTNTEQLVSDGQLRNTYRQRLISLASDGELSHKDVSYLESLFRTMRLAGEGAGFADSFKYTALLDNAKELGIKVPKNDGKEFWNSIIDFFQDPEYDKLILNKSISLKGGVELTHRQLLELVSGMLNDVNIYRLIASNDYTDSAILDIAGKYLVGDAKQGNKKLLSLVSAVKEIPTTDDTRGVILKAITGKDIPADTKVGFFDFRSFLNAADDVKARAEFRDRLAEGNKLNVPSNTIKNITTSSLNGLIKELEQFKGGYILVNDSQWKMNSVFVEALNTVNKGLSDSEKVHIAFPTGGLMGNLSWTKGKGLVFKTSYSEAFNEFMRKVSIRTLGQTQADSAITKEIADAATKGNLDAISKMNQLLEEDARKYFGAMLGVDPYSEDLPYLLEDMTGISFKNYDKIVDKTEFWRKIDEKFMVGLRTVGNYDQEVTTVADVLKQIDNMTPAQIAADLSKKFGYEISEESITEGGKITDKIKNAYINYNLSQTPIELLENKGKLLAVVNGGVADNITIDQFRGMLLSDDYSAYKEIFFHNVDLSDEELAKHVKQINTMVLDGLCAQVADNLVAMGYSLPLVNIRDVVYDYLTDNLNVNGQFANAFIYKNNLPPTLSTLEGIMKEAMPSQLRFGYDDAVENISQDITTFYNKVLRGGIPYENGVRLWGEASSEGALDFIDAVQQFDFRGKINVKRLAVEYQIPIEVMDEYLALFHKDAWATTFVKQRDGITNVLIAARKQVAKGALPHELFHGIFAYLPSQEREVVIEGAMNLYGLSEVKAEEMLADLFSDYYRTGKFVLPREDYIKGVPGFKDIVLRVFETIKRRLLGIDKYEKELKRLYDDILDLKYVDNELREEVDLYGLTLGENLEYTARDWREITFDFDELVDAAEKEGKIPARFMYSGRTRYDIINSMTNQEWFNGLSGEERDWYRAQVSFLEALEESQKSPRKKKISFEDVKKRALEKSKGMQWEGDPKKIMDELDVDDVTIGGYEISPRDVNSAKASKTNASVAKNDTYTLRGTIPLDMAPIIEQRGLPYIKEIRDAILAGKTIPFKEYIEFQINHFKDIGSDFGNAMAEIFSKIDETNIGSINSISDIYGLFGKNTELEKNYDALRDAFAPQGTEIEPYRGFAPSGIGMMFFNKRVNIPDYITRYVEVENQFMPDTYSSLVALSAIKDGARLPNVGHERQVLKNILDDYYNAVKGAVSGKNITFAEAQKLKTQAGYALDMFEQDYLYSRYKQFLTPDEKNELFGLKYGLGVTTNGAGLDDIAEYNNRVLDRYDSATKRIINQNDIIVSSMSKNSKSIAEEVEKRQKELIDKGATMKVIDGQVIVVNIRDELYQQLRHIPDSISGLGVLKSMGRVGLDQLTNEQAYFLLNVVELTKNADNKMNMISQTIYKLKPQLAKIDFFRTFRAVDGLPFALRNNLLTGTDYLAGFSNTATFDDSVKREIFDRIKNAFSREGKLGYKNGKKVVSELEHLNEIINDAIDINVEKLGNFVKGSELRKFKKEAAMVYQMAFNPYTILEDVPKVVKDSMNEILDAQQRGIRDSLKLLGDDDRLTEIMDAISIQLDDGSVKTLRQILDGDKNNLSKTMFDTDLDIINSAEDNAKRFVDPSWSQSKREAIEIQNKKIAEATENNYRDGLQAYLNEAEIVSQGERELLRRVWSSARELAKQYTLTNKLAETDNALYGINEEIVRGFKSDILGFKGLLTRGGQSWLGLGKVGENIQEQILERWTQVKDRYRTLYNMTPEQLAAFEPKNALDTIAANMAKYFKEMEGRLGSIDGVTGATTDMDVNRAFAHIGEVVMNIDSIQGLYSIMSGIEGNQLLKFFRFANVGDAARVEKLVIGGLGEEGFGGYRNYVDKTDNGLDREWFNKTFASNFTDSQYTKLIQALCGFTVVNKNFKLLQKALNFVNGSNYLTRVLMSYPGQLITVGQQSIAYFLKQIGWEKELGIEDLGAIDAIRQQAGILKGAYNEIPTLRYVDVDNLDSSAFYNRYGLPDVDDLMQKQKFYTSDDLSTMYSKIDDYGAQSKGSDMLARFLRNTDAYKDNANNIIDGLFARNFKNIAFVKALQSNNYMTFATAEEFANFMASSAPAEMKTKLMAAVMEASGRNFKNILGLGFSGLDRAVGGGYLRNIFIGLMQMFNFRGAWGQNMARQTSNWIMTGLNMAKKGLSKEGKDAIATYIAHQPEFVNFTKQLFNDLQNMWHLVRFQDNGDWMPEDEHSLLDFIEYAYEVMQFSSQRWQGIQSYGTTRIATEWGESVIQSAANPEIYKDTYGVGALMNNISKNLGRNWKVRNLGMRTLATLTTHGWDAAMEYLGNEFWKLSFGTLRYLMNEDETSYGYNTELIGGRPGAIPSIISGETNDDGDKAYSYDLANSETWLNITSWYDAMKNGDSDTARIYYYNNLDSFINGSQARSFLKNTAKALRPALGDSMRKWLSDGTLATGRVYAMSTPWDLAEVGDLMAQTAVGSELFTQGYSVPRAEADIKILVDEVLKQRSHRPGNDGFNKSMFNFDKSGHMASLDKSNEADAGMEMLLNNIKYERGDNFEFITDEQGRRIVTDYWQMHMNDLNRRINDEDYMTMANFNFINGWVEANNDDPNYMFYKRLIGEGLAGRYMNEKVTEYLDGYNKINGFKKDAKLTKTELTDASGDYQLYAYLSSIESDITGERRGFLESIMLLDKPAALSANIKMIARQMEDLGYKDEIKKMFNVDEDGNVTLSNRYQAYLEEQAKLSKYLDEGDLESFVAETASITRLFEKDDPYGLATTMLITSRINRINQADSLSAEQKAKAINVLMTDNYEFIQQHIPEFIDELGSAAKAYIAQMNESLYDVSLIGDDLTRISEMNKSSSGRKSGISISNKAKNLLGKLGSSTGSGRGVGGGKTYNYNYVPVRLEGSKLLKATGSVGYNPKSASIAIMQYKPHIDLSIGKDINRNIKTTKTQAISTKKQLSDIEKKTTKALTAES